MVREERARCSFVVLFDDAATVIRINGVRLSNEHVKAMLIYLLGSEDVVEAAEGLKINKDEKPFSAISQATQYLREWKTTEDW